MVTEHVLDAQKQRSSMGAISFYPLQSLVRGRDRAQQGPTVPFMASRVRQTLFCHLPGCVMNVLCKLQFLLLKKWDALSFHSGWL